MAKVVTILSRVRGARHADHFVEYPASHDNTSTGQVQAQLYQDLLPVLPKYGIGIALVWARFRLATQPYGGNSRRRQPVDHAGGWSVQRPPHRVGASVDRQHHRGDGRERLLAYNGEPDNPFNLLPAFRLYAHDAYRALADRFGLDRLFILSAGWRLIAANSSVFWASPAFQQATSDQLVPHILLLVAAAGWAVSIGLVRAHRFQASALSLAPWQMLLAAVLLLPCAIGAEGALPEPNMRGPAALAYVGPLATAFA